MHKDRGHNSYYCYFHPSSSVLGPAYIVAVADVVVVVVVALFGGAAVVDFDDYDFAYPECARFDLQT
jgi:hypothetical protein